jgi:hypothetical protein
MFGDASRRVAVCLKWMLRTENAGESEAELQVWCEGDDV